MLGVDFFLYTCCMHIRIQFRLLQHCIENLITSTNVADKITDGAEFHQKIVEIIKWHKKIMQWSGYMFASIYYYNMRSVAFILDEDIYESNAIHVLRCVNFLEVIYAKSTLFNFVSSSALICLTGFNVTAVDDVAVMLSFLSFLSMSLLQIFFLCLFGDMMMQASLDVSTAVYNCKWFMAESALGKQLYLILIRAQKPCKLTAYGYADVNLKAFAKILSTAWSYFALLRRVYNSPLVESD